MVGVAGEDDEIATYLSPFRAHFRPLAVGYVNDGRLLMELGARARRRGRLAKTQVQRMQVPVAHVDQAPYVGPGADDFFHVFPRHQSDFMGKVHALQPLAFFLQLPPLARLEGGVHVTELEIAIDGVSLHPLPDDLVAGPAQIPEQFVQILAGSPALRLPYPLLAAEAAYELTTVAAGGPPAYAVRL